MNEDIGKWFREPENLKKLVLSAAIGFMGFLCYVVPLAERGRAATSDAVDEYYRRYNAGEFPYIRAAMMTDAARAASSEAAMRAAYARLGTHNGGVRRSFKLLDLRGRRFYLRFDASYEKGGATDTFVLVTTPKGLRFDSLPNTCGK